MWAERVERRWTSSLCHGRGMEWERNERREYGRKSEFTTRVTRVWK